jgi:uncharacterized membrane-anchored protein
MTAKLDKPVAKGGLELSRVGASLVLGLAIAALILVTRQKAARSTMNSDA